MQLIVELLSYNFTVHTIQFVVTDKFMQLIVSYIGQTLLYKISELCCTTKIVQVVSREPVLTCMQIVLETGASVMSIIKVTHVL